jgi:hypothetical protein
MDVDPFHHIQYQRYQNKRQKFKPVLRVLIEGLASLIDGQRCFADEFGLSFSRVFHSNLDSFKGQDTRKVLSAWLRDGEEGAEKLAVLFDNLAQHQMALLEAADEVAIESIAFSKTKKSRFADMLGMDVKKYSSKYKSDHELQRALHQHLIVSAFASGYAKARENMKSKQEGFQIDKAVS